MESQEAVNLLVALVTVARVEALYLFLSTCQLIVLTCYIAKHERLLKLIEKEKGE